jgi:hypothetical protein
VSYRVGKAAGDDAAGNAAEIHDREDVHVGVWRGGMVECVIRDVKEGNEEPLGACVRRIEELGAEIVNLPDATKKQPVAKSVNRTSLNVARSIQGPGAILVVLPAVTVVSTTRQHTAQTRAETRNVQLKPIPLKRYRSMMGYTTPPCHVHEIRKIFIYGEGSGNAPTLEPEEAIPRAVALYFRKCVDMLAKEG